MSMECVAPGNPGNKRGTALDEPGLSFIDKRAGWMEGGARKRAGELIEAPQRVGLSVG